MNPPSKVLLMGHPNVGKSALFNRLAGADITDSNYPGTTVDYTESELTLDGRTVPIVDLPGTFSLDPRDRAEEVAVELLEENPDAIVICVVDATRFERGLNLVLEILEQEHDVVVAVNMWDEANRKNIDIDLEKVEEYLDVPAVPTVAIEGVGIKDLIDRFENASSPTIDEIRRRLEGPPAVEA